MKTIKRIFLLSILLFSICMLYTAKSYATDSGEFGTNLCWEISDAGVLTIKPVEGEEEGRLPNAQSGWAGNVTADSVLSPVWPWQTAELRSKIKKIVIEDGVKANNELRYMFYNLSELEDVDISSLEANADTNTAAANDMFKNCSKLKKVELGAKFQPKQMKRMFENCTSLVEVAFGTEESPISARLTDIGKQTDGNIFKNCTALTTLRIPGVDASKNVITTMVSLFAGANTEFKTLEMQGAIIPNMGRDSIFKFSNDTLQVLDLSRADVYQRNLRSLFHNLDDSWEIANYDACKNLEIVIMEETNFIGEDYYEGPPVSAFKMFVGLAALKEVNLKNAKFTGGVNFSQMFQDCTSLEKVDMSGSELDVKKAQRMDKMFYNCSNLITLDLSGFGKLPEIRNMDDLIAGCANLEILNINNLDNSNIGPKNDRHSVYDIFTNGKTATDIGAKEFGREIFGKGKYNVQENFPNLKTIYAQNSTVWMCKNNRGLPGNEYFLAANESDVLYFTRNITTFKPDGKSEVTIRTKRDYIDLIIDRDGVKNHTLTPEATTLPDQGQNINIKGGDLNKLGEDTFRPGKLAPGVYTIKDTAWEVEKIDPSQSYYRIHYIGEVPYVVEGPENHGQLKMTTTNNNTFINTVSKTKAEWDAGKDANGNYVIDCSGDKAIKITYEGAAVDVEGVIHDVVITITKITFKDIDKIPLAPNRVHDGNNYINKNTSGAGGGYTPDSNGEYYRTILQASKKEGLTFRNYVRVGNPKGFSGGDENSESYRAISGGSGTDIEFTVEIKDAIEGKAFVFYVDDLDVPATQDWIYTNDDACYDKLPIENANYGIGGEAFVLGDGNRLNTITFADHTGLRVVDGNKVVSTGSDPSTSWSEFAVKANATGSNYTWTSGIACDSYALKNTLPPSNKLKITKVWDDRGDTLSPRPDNLQIDVANFNGTIPAWTKNDDNTWTMIIDDPEHTYNPGYSVTETYNDDKYEVVKGTSDFIYNEDTGYFEATLENKEKTVDITVEKKWVDTDEQKDKRPEKIKIVLLDGDTQVKIYELDTATENSYTFTDLPMYDKNGDEIAYNVKEEEVNDGDLKFYTRKTVFDEITNKWTITNTFTNRPEDKIEIEVTKKWVDTEKQRHRRPDNIRLVLKNGNDVVQEYNLKTKEETSYIFKDLAKYDKNGNEIKYTVDEEEINVGDLRFYSKSIDGFQITNTYKEIPTKIIVKYIDQETGEALSEEIVIEGEVEDEYSTKSKTFQGYALVKIEGKTSGQMAEEVQEVTYYYVRIHEESPIVNEVKEKFENPKTGDNIMLWITIMVVSGLGFRVTSKGFKRAKRVRR